MRIILFIALEFLCGSLMFSYWLGLLMKKNLSTVGDGNPGAFNLIHAVGLKVGLAGVFLDFMKGYFPLVLLVSFGLVKDLSLVPVAIAPVLGHAFSPFLKFKGGKAIAVTFGVWSAVRFEIAFVFAVFLAVLAVIARLLSHGKTSSEADAVMCVLGMACVLVYLIWRDYSYPFILLCILNFMLLTLANRKKLLAFYKMHRHKSIQEQEAVADHK